MKLARKFAGAVGAILLAAIAGQGADAAKPAGAAVKSEDLFPDKVVARGKGFEVKRSEVEAEVLAFKMEVMLSGGAVPEAKRAEFERVILDRIIITRIMLRKAIDDDKAKAKEKVDTEIARIKVRLGSAEAFNRWVLARGYTEEEFRRQALDRMIADEVYNREVKSKIVIADTAVKKVYEDHPEQFKQPEMVRVAHILRLTIDPRLLSVQDANPELSDEQKKIKRQEIETLLKRVRDGEDFARLAKENSEDPNTRDKGGELPPFPHGTMSQEFETAAFTVGVEQVSDIVNTKFGYHIIKVLEKMPAQQLEFDKVKDIIREKLIRDESNKQEPAYKERIKKEAAVEIIEDK